MAHPHFNPRAKRTTHQWPALAGLTALVLLGHWTLLMAAPQSERAAFSTGDAAPLVFTTRSIAPPVADIAPAPPAPVATPPLVQHTPSAPRAANPSDLPPSDIATQKQVSAPLEIEDTAPKNIALDATEPPVVLAAADIPSAGVSSMSNSSDNSSTEEATPPSFAIPGSARLKYEVKGVVGGTSYTGGGELLWQHDGKAYNARLSISKFFIPLRVQTSKGQLTAQGLEPTRFGDKKGGEVAAHFERHLNKIVFSANTPDAPLLPGGQDQLSVFIQLGAMLGGEPARYSPGSTLTLQAVGSHYSEQWEIVFGNLEKKNLPGGEVNAVKLSREPVGAHDTKVETWFAPDLDYLPVHIRLSQKNGDFVDMLWSSTEKP